MTYQIVQCHVLWNADYFMSGNETLGEAFSLGEYESKEDACKAFMEFGFTETEFNRWVKPYCNGHIYIYI